MWSQRIPEPIRGLSTATSLAIFRVEQASGNNYVFVGSTRRAVDSYRAFTLRPGPLYPLPVVCECPGCPLDDSVVHARDLLEHVLERLPVRARAELWRLVLPLDVEFRWRTLPDPHQRRHFRNMIDLDAELDPWWYDVLPCFERCAT
ncbi:hypothetical protein ACIA8G_26430 [Lentzea sp. NPDC051213]|uniref:hypothetical protein n=1 Tax=Lentzea sp. NPDC051213 TaxID=3364126 RepID=UPI0037B036A6